MTDTVGADDAPVVTPDETSAVLTMQPAGAELQPGATGQWVVLCDPDGQGPEPPQPVTGVVQWNSTDERRARVSPAGVVTGLAPGQVAIYAVKDGQMASAQVTIAAP